MHKRLRNLFLKASWIGSTLVLLVVSTQLAAATFTVDTTSDSAALSACTVVADDCSLRGAIIAANALAGADDIEFNIPLSDVGCDVGTGVCRIEVAADYPGINQSLSINGYTQPNAAPNTIPAPGANNAQLKIEVTSQGGFLSNKLFTINGSTPNFELSGLAIFLPTNGMVSIGLRHVYRGNWFGVTAAGEAPTYTSPGTVFDLGSFNRSIVIGGPNPADRNVIAGSGRDLNGVPGGGSSTIRVNSINADRGLILLQGNLIGLAPDGVTPLPFRDPLIVNPGDDAFETPDVQILDNRFARADVNFSCTCGGLLRFSVSRNMADAMLGARALIQGNVFGLGVDDNPIGTISDHIEIILGNNSRVPNVLIGGLGIGEGNVFAGARPLSVFNLGSAVVLPSGSTIESRVEIVGNHMLGNRGLGMDLRQESIPILGRSLNDADDADTGANHRQNFPEISAFAVNGNQFDVTYRVDSDPANSVYPLRVDFYRALGDEGEELLDSDVYELVDAQSDKSVTLTIPSGIALGTDDVLVAVTTDAEGRSSEFSFDTVELFISDLPDPHPAGLPFDVEVTAVATSGPFKPNGIVTVSMNTSPATVCTLELLPSASPNTSRGSCSLLPIQTGMRTLTATYDTLQGAFSDAIGANATATEPHETTAAGPEQVGFRVCRASGHEGQDLMVDIFRPSGGVADVMVDLSHEAGTATEGVDYVAPADQTLHWLPGDVEPKHLVIPINTDAEADNGETFRLRLSNPVNTALLPHALLEVALDGRVEAVYANGFEGTCPQ